MTAMLCSLVFDFCVCMGLCVYGPCEWMRAGVSIRQVHAERLHFISESEYHKAQAVLSLLALLVQQYKY